jgi:hypothetical protein
MEGAGSSSCGQELGRFRHSILLVRPFVSWLTAVKLTARSKSMLYMSRITLSTNSHVSCATAYQSFPQVQCEARARRQNVHEALAVLRIRWRIPLIALPNDKVVIHISRARRRRLFSGRDWRNEDVFLIRTLHNVHFASRCWTMYHKRLISFYLKSSDPDWVNITWTSRMPFETSVA